MAMLGNTRGFPIMTCALFFRARNDVSLKNPCKNKNTNKRALHPMAIGRAGTLGVTAGWRVTNY